MESNIRSRVFIAIIIVASIVQNGHCQFEEYFGAGPEVPAAQSFSKFSSRLNTRQLFQPHQQPQSLPQQQYQQQPAQNPVNLQHDFTDLFNFNKRPSHSANIYGQCPATIPYLGDIAASCPKNDFYFGMNPKHMEAVGRLKEIMMNQNSAEAAICLAGELRDRPEVNPSVWFNSLMSTVINRRDLRGLRHPPLVEIMPSMFVNSDVLNQARRMSTFPQNQRNPTCIVSDGSAGRDNGIENALWYWREDILLNAEHWFWHLSNPFTPTPVNGRVPPRPDRRGELFFYFHHSILGRYNAERIANGLPKLVPLELTHGEVIKEPYYAHFDGTHTGQRWGDRPPNTPVQDILFNSIPDTPVNITIDQHREQVRRIGIAVKTGQLLRPDNSLVNILNFQGVDLLAEVVESSIYSVNPNYYGRFGVHNEGHFFIGLSHDARGQRRLSPGIMTDSTTAMRDPAFYRYHTPVAAIFHDHKDTLPPHHPTEGDFPLLWQGVRITNAQVVSRDRRPNELSTFWNHAQFDLSRGLDFNRSQAQGQGPVYICAQHLDHEPFSYEITIEKDASVRSNSATIRVFMAPRYDVEGRPFPLSTQRFRFFAMDHFTVRLNNGRNFITRKSLESALTIPWPQRIDELEQDTQLLTPHCGCGWPHHLLVPKGTARGMVYDLFFMVTNGEEDAVRQIPGTPASNCKAASIFCGIPGQLYPDSKPMGYPFDRLPYSIYEYRGGPVRQVRTLDEYTRGITNMGFTQIRIFHQEGYN